MKKILVVGQTPPPAHGQSIMIAEMLKGDFGDIQLIHVRMEFSKTIDEVGQFSLRKIIKIVLLILKIIWVRIRHHTRVLYYPPAGPDKIPIFRDIIILNAVRWLFACTVFHFHATGFTTQYHDISCFLRFLFRRAYFFPEVALHISELIAEDGKFLRAKSMYFVPNGIDDASKMVDGVERVCHPGTINLLYVGTVRESKGIDVLISACEELVCRGKKVDLNIVGEPISGSYRELIESRIQGTQLKNVIHFLGYKQGIDKWKIFASSDIFCFPTFYEAESFPVVLLEALCFGLPILTTAWRGIPSIVEDGVNGFLLPINSTVGLIDKLELLINSPELRRKIGDANREKFLNQFTMDKYIDNLKRVFTDAVNSYAS